MKEEYIYEVVFCCEEMKNHNEIGIYVLEEGDHGVVDLDGVTLIYCPFCGKKIEVIKVGTEELHEDTR